MKNDRAYHAIQDLLIFRDCERTVFGIINSYIEFLEVGKLKSKSKWKTDQSWKMFVGENRLKLKLTTESKPIELSRTLLWLRRQIAPTLKALLLIDQKNQTNKINDLLNETKLTPKHEKLIEQYTTVIQEMIFDED